MVGCVCVCVWGGSGCKQRGFESCFQGRGDGSVVRQLAAKHEDLSSNPGTQVRTLSVAVCAHWDLRREAPVRRSVRRE